MVRGERFLRRSVRESGLFTPNHDYFKMKFYLILPMSVLPVLMISCANQGGDEAYDVANPYAAPDYGVAEGSPFAGDDGVNPIYDSPPVYDDTAFTPPAAPSRPATPRPPAASARTHTVVRGDTLWGLSRQYGVSVDGIKQANNMTRDTVVLGTTLRIPAR